MGLVLAKNLFASGTESSHIRCWCDMMLRDLSLLERRDAGGGILVPFGSDGGVYCQSRIWMQRLCVSLLIGSTAAVIPRTIPLNRMFVVAGTMAWLIHRVSALAGSRMTSAMGLGSSLSSCDETTDEAPARACLQISVPSSSFCSCYRRLHLRWRRGTWGSQSAGLGRRADRPSPLPCEEMCGSSYVLSSSSKLSLARAFKCLAEAADRRSSSGSSAADLGRRHAALTLTVGVEVKLTTDTQNESCSRHCRRLLLSSPCVCRWSLLAASSTLRKLNGLHIPADNRSFDNACFGGLFTAPHIYSDVRSPSPLDSSSERPRRFLPLPGCVSGDEDAKTSALFMWFDHEYAINIHRRGKL